MYRVLFKARRQRSGESLQEFEANINRLTRLAYPETLENLWKWISLSAFIDSIRDSELQQMLRIVQHQNKSDTLVDAVCFEAAKLVTYGN